MKALRFMVGMCLAAALIGSGAQAQEVTGRIIGQVTGGDISVAGPSQLAPGENAQTIAFAAGSTIVVHSGQARVEFTGGGELDVCGPAKFAVLASGEAITIALSFGRVHAKFDSSRPISIYTPLIIATPLAVADQPRDVILGLAPTTGAMCVVAAHGAVQVQQQFSGETLIVPQPSEVLLAGTPLGATPASAGSCRCDFDDISAKPASPERVVAENTLPVGVATTSPANSSAASHPSAVEKPEAQRLTPEAGEKTDHPDFPPPVVPAAKPRRPVPPPTLPPADGPITKIVAPLLYEAKPLPAPAGTISVATVLLAKAVVVEPEWIIHGVVEEPAKASKKGSPEGVKQASGKKKSGFWGWFHRFLFGSPPKST